MITDYNYPRSASKEYNKLLWRHKQNINIVVVVVVVEKQNSPHFYVETAVKLIAQLHVSVKSRSSSVTVHDSTQDAPWRM